MKSELIQPQEAEVFYILPAIRHEMALALKADGKKQKEIAKILCVGESTISQYMNKKRASNIKFDSSIKASISDSALKIKDRVTLVAETQKLLALIKKSNALCRIHQKISNLPASCNACFSN